MSWWNNALYDTCSLITIANILLDHDGLSSHFTAFLAIEISFSAEQMRAETRERLQPRLKTCDLPPLAELNRLLSSEKLRGSLATVDRLIYAAAVHHRHPVVTADKDLGKLIAKGKLKVANVSLILKEMALARRVTKIQYNAILASLVHRKDCILGNHVPTWNTLQEYRFP